MTNRLRGEIRDMLRVEQRAGGFASGGSAFRAVLDVDTSLGVFPDHFRDGPILPGICLVHAVLLAGAKTRGVDELRIRVLKNLKLTQPVRPGQRVKIEAEMTPVGGSGGFAFRGDLAIKAKLSVGDRRCAEVSLVAYAAPDGEASAPDGEGAVPAGLTDQARLHAGAERARATASSPVSRVGPDAPSVCRRRNGNPRKFKSQGSQVVQRGEPVSQPRVEDVADELVERFHAVGLLEIAETAVAQHPPAFLIVAVAAGDDNAHAGIDLLHACE